MSATPLTDAAEKAYVVYTSNPPDGLWQELQDGGNEATSEWIAKAPPNGWKYARTLELRCQELEKEVQYLKSSECEAAWCDRWKNLCAQNEQLREALDKVGFRCAGNALTKAEATHISNFILQTLSQSTPTERKEG